MSSLRKPLASKALFLCAVLLTACLGTATAARAQSGESALPGRTWGRVGVAKAVQADGDGNGFVGSVHHQRGPHLFSARGTFLLQGDPGTSMLGMDAGLLYGRAASTNWGHASASAGLAWTDPGSDEGLGVPVQGRVHVTPPGFPYVGLSLGVFANLNLDQPFAGVSLGLAFGDLR